MSVKRDTRPLLLRQEKKKNEFNLLAIPYLSLIHILAKISVRICFCICKARMYTNQMNDRILDFSNFLQYLRFKLRTSFFPLYLLNHTECVSIEMSCYDVQCKNCNIATSFHLSSSSCSWKHLISKGKFLLEISFDFFWHYCQSSIKYALIFQ